ncbi:MAG: hypothetical protein WAX04_07495 [Oscillospiraceae bacterium]
MKIFTVIRNKTDPRSKINIFEKFITIYIMAPPKKYTTDEERLKAHRRQQNSYSKKRAECNICKKLFTLGNKTKHLKSVWHMKIVNGEESDVSSNSDKI